MKKWKISERWAFLGLLLFIEVWIAYLHWHLTHLPLTGIVWAITFAITIFFGIAVVIQLEVED